MFLKLNSAFYKDKTPFFKSPKLKTSHNYYLVYEYCSNGTLEDLLKK